MFLLKVFQPSYAKGMADILIKDKEVMHYVPIAMMMYATGYVIMTISIVIITTLISLGDKQELVLWLLVAALFTLGYLCIFLSCRKMRAACPS